MKNYLIILGIIVAVFAGTYFSQKGSDRPVTYAGGPLGVYSATTTDYSWPTASLTGRQIKTGAGVLGSVILGNATAVGTLTLYDATTTVNGGIYGTTTLAVINTGSLSTTYNYDVGFTRGLLAVITSTLATTTITSQ